MFESLWIRKNSKRVHSSKLKQTQLMHHFPFKTTSSICFAVFIGVHVWQIKQSYIEVGTGYISKLGWLYHGDSLLDIMINFYWNLILYL